MQADFGFLLREERFTLELPETLDPSFELVSTIGLHPGLPLSLQCALGSRVDFASFGWVPSPNKGAPWTGVYEVPGDPSVAMPVWHVGPWVLWMQIRARSERELPELLATHRANIHPSIDDDGIPRVRLGGRLSPGNPISEAIHREHCIFAVPEEGRVVVLRYDGALGRDRVARDGDYALVTVTTPAGISVLCDGPRREQTTLVAEGEAIASSIRQAA
jgi:hypothetical protein